MKPEMSNEEAITRINRFLAYLEEIWTPQCGCNEALIRRDDITAFVIARDVLKEQRPHGEWIPCKDDNFCKCSRCGIIVMSEEAEDFGYCPKCGSDNRKREGDEK